MTQMIMTEQKIEEIPYIMVEKAHLKGKPCPTVFYLHGFNGEKDASLTTAYRIAQHGIRVILPDALMHGDREGNVTQTEKELAFWEIILQSVKEVEVLKNELENQDLLVNNKIGIGGTSMGGIITSAMMTQYHWIDAAVIVMGSPNLTNYASRLMNDFNNMNTDQIREEDKKKVEKDIESLDLTKNPSVIKNKPLLFWHGENDDVVPIKYAWDFYESNKDLAGSQMEFVKEPGRAHNVTKLAMNETAKWFAKYLL